MFTVLTSRLGVDSSVRIVKDTKRAAMIAARAAIRRGATEAAVYGPIGNDPIACFR